ncbi:MULTISPECIES: hypothetical protein [unclassified Luteibacter]|uniref:hypothetical protein n=1 Tax=unclassified Luteibacter TaxID=2620188 RepID=UPI0012E01FE2|nr:MULTISPECIES: hypothetical protein [unclassified Luteibacter]MDR6644508.1 hypothetical protein [Luteibacter sp. 1214]
MDDSATFKYGRLAWLVLLVSLAIVSMATYAFIRAAQQFRPGDLPFFIVGIPLVTVCVVSPLLAYRDVVISSKGIGRSFFGVCTGLIPWERVTSVRCGVLSGNDQSVNTYHLRVGNRAIFGGVRLMTMIDDVDELIAKVSAEVERRAIPVTAWHANKLVTLERLPPPIKGPAAWE